MSSANRARGDIALGDWRFRPSFANLVAAEAEIGSLFALVDAAGNGTVQLQQIIGLLWHCLDPQPDETGRSAFAEDVLALGLVQITPVFRHLLETILGGS